MMESLGQAKAVHEVNNAVFLFRTKRLLTMSFSPDYCGRRTLNSRVV